MCSARRTSGHGAGNNRRISNGDQSIAHIGLLSAVSPAIDDGIPGVTVSFIREYTMASEFSELSIEPRGNDYVLKVSDREGATSEIILSEETVIFLGRLAPTIARQIVASKARAEGDISASVAAAAKDFELNTDIHDQLVLLRIRDEFDAEFDFSFLPSGAKYLGERLIAWSEKLESAPKRTTQ
jgi:hypothetical protein